MCVCVCVCVCGVAQVRRYSYSFPFPRLLDTNANRTRAFMSSHRSNHCYAAILIGSLHSYYTFSIFYNFGCLHLPPLIVVLQYSNSHTYLLMEMVRGTITLLTNAKLPCQGKDGHRVDQSFIVMLAETARSRVVRYHYTNSISYHSLNFHLLITCRDFSH